MTSINVRQLWSVKNMLINFSLNLLYKKRAIYYFMINQSSTFLQIFLDWLVSYIGSRYKHDSIMKNDRTCGLPIVGYVTRGNFCSSEQYVALTYCTSATSTSWCCHATSPVSQFATLCNLHLVKRRFPAYSNHGV